MIERLRPRSLNAKMAAMMVLSLFCALLVFGIVNGVGALIVDHYYMAPDTVSVRKAEIYSAFNRYIINNSVSATDTEAIGAWDEYGDYVDVYVYSDDEDEHLASAKQYNGLYGKLYPLSFADGQHYIAISDNTRSRELMVNNISAIISAAVAFILIMLSYVRRLSIRIIRLSSEAMVIGAGALEAEISTEGEDELSMLAKEVDNMRKSVIERMAKESRAYQANHELITAISHDIRTPMTALIGYLGLLHEGDPTDTERTKQFTAAAYGKAMDLKDLTDELFKYFLVFGKSELELNMEEFDSALLLEQLLGEAEYELGDMGFHVQRIDTLEGSGLILADAMYLKRVMDNMVSNIKKYADRERPVVMLTEQSDNMLRVCISNSISRSMNKAESTKIGLRTCVKIMEHMGGSFVSRTENGHFAAEFALPLKNQNK